MPIRIHCHSCSYTAQLRDNLAGIKVACPKCRETIRVPDAYVEAVHEIVPDEIVFDEAAAPRQRRKSAALSKPLLAPEPPRKNLPRLAAMVGAGVLVIGVIAALGFLLGRQRAPAAAPLAAQVPETTRSSPTVTTPQAVAAVPQPSAPFSQPQVVATESKPETPAQLSAQPPAPNVAAPTAATVAVLVEPVPVAKAERPLTKEVVFETVELDEPVTSMDMTGDGLFLVLTHQSANRVSFFDVLQNRVVEARTVESPRSVLCRGGRAYVASYGKGKIRVFSQAGNWQLENELQVIKPNIMHIAAAADSSSPQQLIVTCHGDGNQASYQDCHIYVVDTQTDECRPLLESPLASVSYDGKQILVQSSFNLSPAGSVSVYNAKDLITRGGKATPSLTWGGIGQTPYMYQTCSTGFWISRNMVFGGTSFKQIEGDFGLMIVPDLSQKLIYTLTEDVLRAHRLNSAMTSLGMRRVTYPSLKDDFSKVWHDLYRMRGYLLDHPLAYTHGDRLLLFVQPAGADVLWRAETQLFEAPPAVTASQRNDPEPAPAAATPKAAKLLTSEPNSPMDQNSGEALAAVFAGFPRICSAEQMVKHRLPLPMETEVVLVSEIAGASLKKGEFRWTPQSDQVGLHELKFRVTRSGEISFQRLTLEVVDSEVFALAKGDLSQLNQFQKLPLDPDTYSLSSGLEQSTILLLQGSTLRILKDDGITVAQTRKLPNRYEWIEERSDAFVAVGSNPNPALDIIDKKSLKVQKRIELTSGGTRVINVTDLAIHPSQKLSYVAIHHDIELPCFTVLVIDEESGRVQVPGILGKWVEVSPDGKTLYSGYSDIYQNGSHFHVNPGWRLIEIPEYGNVDMLLAWDSGRKYQLRQIVRDAGGNGKGIRVSPDGKRLTYLSHVGSPKFSGNLTGVNAADFANSSVAYETKDRGTTQEMAYHPILPLVASPGSGSAVFFHRETGKLESNRLLISSAGLGATQVERIFFSPNGRQLIFMSMDDEHGRQLQAVPLKLSSQEKEAKPAPREVFVERPKVQEPVARKDIHALDMPDTSEPISPAEIGKRSMDAVVQVLTESSSGTGFFIGKTGYLLTAEHVVNGADTVDIVYNVRGANDSSEPLKSVATVICVDEEADLALLKCSPAQNVTCVILSPETKVESGEAVTIIGNPALGTEILSSTMTTGIVSNPNRKIEGRRYLQTSAAINPGNSGGPMFDSRGHVIGLVTLKGGGIEGAGFAVPADTMKAFILSAAFKK